MSQYTEAMLTFIDARIDELQKHPGAREGNDVRIFELELFREYCLNLQRGETMVFRALGITEEA